MNRDLNSIKIKTALACLTYVVGNLYLKFWVPKLPKILILMYHRILPSHQISAVLQPGMYVEAKTFEGQIRYLQRHFNLLTPQSFVDLVHSNSKTERSKPDCLITFDDGWMDFYDYAFPILKKYDAPATVFLPTDYIGTNRRFWTDHIAVLLHHAHETNAKSRPKESNASGIVSQLEALSGPLDVVLEKAIDLLKPFRLEVIEEIIEALGQRWDYEIPDKSRAFLSWEEVRELFRSGLVFFGSHTASHPILTTLGHTEIKEELKTSSNKLLSEKVAMKGNVPFCYPNGNYSSEIAKLVKETGYSFAVTTQSGWNELKSDMYALQRIGIHQDISSTIPLLNARILELF